MPFLVLRSSYSDELKAASIAFRTEVESIINKSQTLVAECNDLIETLQYSAGSLQEEVSDIVNDTLTEVRQVSHERICDLSCMIALPLISIDFQFGKDVNKLITDVSIDVSECTALSFTFESRATDILVDTNTCVYDKLNDANTLTDETISAIQYTMARMFSIKKIVDDNLNASMINQGKMTVPQALIFLKEVSAFASSFTLLEFFCV